MYKQALTYRYLHINLPIEYDSNPISENICSVDQSRVHPNVPSLRNHLLPPLLAARRTRGCSSPQHIFQALHLLPVGACIGGGEGVGCVKRYYPGAQDSVLCTPTDDGWYGSTTQVADEDLFLEKAEI